MPEVRARLERAAEGGQEEERLHQEGTKSGVPPDEPHRARPPTRPPRTLR